MMELTPEPYEEIKPYLPGQRGNVKLSNRKVLNGILSVAEQGCKWRGLPGRFGNWHTIYRRMNRWAKTGVLNSIFEAWPAKKIIPVRIEGSSLIAHLLKYILMEQELKKNGKQSIGKSPGGWTTKIHLLAPDAVRQ